MRRGVSLFLPTTTMDRAEGISTFTPSPVRLSRSSELGLDEAEIGHVLEALTIEYASGDRTHVEGHARGILGLWA
jgi:hypothetical protein